MKICQLCAVDFTMARFLLPLMRGMADVGHEVVGICSDGPELEKVRAAGFRVIPVPIHRSLAPVRALRAVVAIRKILRREQFDLLHVHTPVAAAVGRIASIGTQVPRVVYTAHGFYFHDRMAAVKRASFIAVEWFGGRLTNTLFTQSAEDAATAQRFRLCRTGHVVAIGNGSDPVLFSPDRTVRAKVRGQLGTSRDRVVIISIGRLVAEKGFPELIEAMRHVDAELWIVGDRLTSDHAGPIENAIAETSRDQVLGARVRLLGKREDVPDLLRAADIFCLASHREGMPRSIIEAMLSGLPVVATDIRGCREEVVDGETGIIVPVNDPANLVRALQGLLTDPEKRDRLAIAGRARALALYDEASVIERQLEHLGLCPPHELSA